ncbi:hypothetical protein E2C01_007578 [Portunus trituberculatus]|uniref:Uncharacterized protein n=1 Tax=Portunus trituberculatus TaxID=210409 RepID=A0A5B7D4J3_PORTR|nr:hypothetical protein [Portunus trituberculatus]
MNAWVSGGRRLCDVHLSWLVGDRFMVNGQRRHGTAGLSETLTTARQASGVWRWGCEWWRSGRDSYN